jgi:hypothetical protein
MSPPMPVAVAPTPVAVAPTPAPVIETAPIVVAPTAVPNVEPQPSAVPEFAINTNLALAPTPNIVVGSAPVEAAPTFNINAASTPIVVPDPEPAVTSTPPSVVLPVEESEAVGAVSVAAPVGESTGFAISPSTTVSPNAISSSVAGKTNRKPTSARGKKPALPFNIDPKYLQPKYLIGGGAGLIAVLSLLLIAVIASRPSRAVPGRAVKAIPPRSAAPSAVQTAPAGQSGGELRQPMFNLPAGPAPSRPK